MNDTPTVTFTFTDRWTDRATGNFAFWLAATVHVDRVDGTPSRVLALAGATLVDISGQAPTHLTAVRQSGALA